MIAELYLRSYAMRMIMADLLVLILLVSFTLFLLGFLRLCEWLMEN
jgi:hypothetical protein